MAEAKVKQLNIPMILYVSYRCLKDKKSFSKLVEHIKQFLEDYNDPDKLQDYKKQIWNCLYRQLCSQIMQI